MFVIEGENRREPVASMPGVERLSVDEIVRDAERAAKLGIPAIAFFPFTEVSLRDPVGSEALNGNNLVMRAVRAVKRAVPGLGIMTDVALDPYTSHGHDGLMKDGAILNDETVAVLVEQSLIQAEAGTDIIAPSDMMDGRVGAIRRALDKAGFLDVQIMAYAAKYASAFYGPFRDAIGTKAALVGGQAHLPDGSRQLCRSFARGRPRPRGRSRFGHGKAGPFPISTSSAGPGHVRGADLRLPSVGRVRDDRGGRPQRLARR